VKGKKRNKLSHLIWLATLWSIWLEMTYSLMGKWQTCWR